VKSDSASVLSLGHVKPKQLVRTWVEAFNRADVSALAALYADDAINHQVAESPVQGRENIRQMFATEFAKATMHCVIENYRRNSRQTPCDVWAAHEYNAVCRPLI